MIADGDGGDRRRPAWWVIALAALLVIALVVALFLFVRSLGRCGADVGKVDGECIGVTDGTTELAPEFSDALGRIRAENERVVATGQPWVSIGYLIPMARPGTPAGLELPALRHEMEGAVVAQLTANRSRAIRGDRPLVRLLVANGGDGMRKWDEVVPTLKDMALGDRFADERLVTVIATGQSRKETQNAVTDLTNAGVPVVTSRLTADQIIDSPSIGSPLARISPVNSDAARAVATYARSRGTRALLVQDADPDDTYAQSLGKAFVDAFVDPQHSLLRPTETYDPSADVDTMASVLGNVCAQRPDVVFFAGRATELLPFVEALPRRTCQDLPITVVTASDAVDFAAAVPRSSDAVREGLAGNTSLVFAGEASPGAWSARPEFFAPGAPTFLQGDCELCYGRLFPAGDLADGAAIMGHDAVTTATWAIRLNRGGNTSPERVAQAFKRLHGPDVVPLASGWLSVGETGNPVQKGVPVLQVRPDGRIDFVDLRSGSPSGSPCLPNAGTC